nr:thiamine phosphate synthase [Nocardioides alcanivorans]
MTRMLVEPFHLSLYLVTDAAQAAAAGRGLVETVIAAVNGGMTTVQVREKDAGARDVLHLVEALSTQLPAQVPLLVNDRVDLYLAARARGLRVSGIHVGQRDLPVDEVRSSLVPRRCSDCRRGLRPSWRPRSRAPPGWTTWGSARYTRPPRRQMRRHRSGSPEWSSSPARARCRLWPSAGSVPPTYPRCEPAD